MKLAPVAEVKAKFSEFIKECKNGPIVVTKNGRPAAALVSIDSDDDLERILFSSSKMLQTILDMAEKRIKSGKGISSDDFWNQMKKEKIKDKKVRR